MTELVVLETSELVVLVTAVLSVLPYDTISEEKSVVSVVFVDAKSLVVIEIMGSLELGKIKNVAKKGQLPIAIYQQI